jgi:hypothetical protein
MMCNPNITPNGATPAGLLSGNNLTTTGQFYEALEKSSRGIARTIAKLRHVWLRTQMLRLGMPPEMLAGVEAGEAGWIRLAHRWVRLHGFTWRAELLNTIELFQYGESVAFAKLFEMPYHHEDKTAEGY